MTISLEEEEQGEDELHEMGANIVTLDEEVVSSKQFKTVLEHIDIIERKVNCVNQHKQCTFFCFKKFQSFFSFFSDENSLMSV